MSARGDDWQRIALDLRATTGITLDLKLYDGGELGADWCDVDVFLDRTDVGGFGRRFPDDAEAFVATLADLLRESFLDEEVWGGWPVCPDHRTHPLESGVNDSGAAAWFCPRGREVAAIGRLVR